MSVLGLFFVGVTDLFTLLVLGDSGFVGGDDSIIVSALSFALSEVTGSVFAFFLFDRGCNFHYKLLALSSLHLLGYFTLPNCWFVGRFIWCGL